MLNLGGKGTQGRHVDDSLAVCQRSEDAKFGDPGFPCTGRECHDQIVINVDNSLRSFDLRWP